MSDQPIVLLTALDLEYAALRSLMTGVRPHLHPQGTRFEVGRFKGTKGQVAIALVGKGNHAAATLTERAMNEFKPAAIIFVGIAGALRRGLQLGDVVVASHVYAYHGATSTDKGSKTRPRVWETSHEIDQIAHHVARTGAWARDLPTFPKVVFGPLASGEVVLNSRTSSDALLLEERFNDAVAIEMEAAGVAQAAHLNSSLSIAVVRGISDRADGTKETTDREQWQPRAVANAAAFAVALVNEISGRSRNDINSTRSLGMSGGVHFNNSDNVKVRFQVGNIGGNAYVSENSTPADSLVVGLESLGRMLEEAYRAGRLDEVTYQAAKAELTVAEETRNTATKDGTGRFLLALKKLYGLVSNLADLADKVNSLIHARGRS